MQKNHVKARRFEPERDMGGASYAAVGRRRADPLAIPEIGCALGGNPAEAQFVLSMMDAGLVNEAECIDDQPGTIIQKSMSAFRQTRLPENALTMEITEYLAITGDGYHADTHSWTYALETEIPPVRVMEPKYAELEAMCPGMAETVMYHMTIAGAWLTFPGTPEGVRERATYMLWYGMDDQAKWEEEFVGMGGELNEDHMGEHDCPAVYDGTFPGWMLNTQRRVPNRKLKKLARRSKTAASLARLLLRIQRLCELMPEIERDGECAYPAFILRWNEDDSLVRTLDDSTEALYGQAETTLWYESFEHGVDGINAWKEEANVVLSLLGCINQVLEIVSVPDPTLS